MCVFIIKLNDIYIFFNVLFSPIFLPFSSLSIWRTFAFQDEEYYYHIGTCDFFYKKIWVKNILFARVFYTHYLVNFLFGFQ